jgi:hypothetical protein
MPIGSDYRQSIILALQQEGGDVAGQVIDLLRQLGREQGVVNKQWADGSITGAQYVAMQARINAEGEKWRGVLREIRDQQAGLTAAMEETLVPLNKLIVDSLKYADVLEKTRARSAASDERAQQLRDEAELQAALGRMEQRVADDRERAQRTSAAAVARGTQAVRDFTEAVRAAASAEEREFADLESLNRGFQHNAQFVGMATAATREQVQALKDMGIIQGTVTAKMASGAGQFGGFATAADQAADRTKKFGYAAMNASYLIQDMQYGVGAVANNVGLMAQSLGNASPWLTRVTAGIGGPAGLGAGIMVAAVAADLLHKNWGSITAAFGEGVPPKLINDTKDLEARLKELEAKTWKAEIDYSGITAARDEIRRLTEDEAAYQRLRTGKTEAQQKQSEVVSRAIIEGGGTGDYESGVDNVTRALMEIRGNAKSPQLIQMENELAGVKEMAAQSARAGLDDSGFVHKAGVLEKEIQARTASDAVDRELMARRVVTRAASGNVGALGELSAAFEGNEGAFTRRGIDPLRLGAGLANAAPGALFADDRRKMKAADDARLKAAAEQAEVERIRHEQQMKADAEREAQGEARKKEAEAVWQIQQAQRLDGEKKQAEQKAAREKEHAERDERNRGINQLKGQWRDQAKAERNFAKNLPKAAKQASVVAAAQEFQGRTGADDLTSMAAGKQIAAKVEKGVNPEAAIREVYTAMVNHARESNMAFLRMQRDAEMASGQIGQATMTLRQIEQQGQMQRQMLNRNQQRRPTLGRMN